jgi:hypothetical protein
MTLIYKIRDKKTGLYSGGGSWVHWTKNGKSWGNIGHVKAHLKQVDYYRRGTVYANAELVVFEIKETSSSPLPCPVCKKV